MIMYEGVHVWWFTVITHVICRDIEIFTAMVHGLTRQDQTKYSLQVQV